MRAPLRLGYGRHAIESLVAGAHSGLSSRRLHRRIRCVQRDLCTRFVVPGRSVSPRTAAQLRPPPRAVEGDRCDQNRPTQPCSHSRTPITPSRNPCLVSSARTGVCLGRPSTWRHAPIAMPPVCSPNPLYRRSCPLSGSGWAESRQSESRIRLVHPPRGAYRTSDGKPRRIPHALHRWGQDTGIAVTEDSVTRTSGCSMWGFATPALISEPVPGDAQCPIRKWCQPGS